jgi:hypothetical protein
VGVVPESVYSPQEYRVLVAKAIKRATSSLVKNFIATIEPKLMPAETPGKDGKKINTAMADQS